MKIQNRTEVSLFMRSDVTKYLKTVSSASGDLFNSIGHHGPAIENEWMALRLYFDHKAAIDVYSKSKPGLELRGAQWYPTPEQQRNGWGADYYKVGDTVGLGGIRLWDGNNVQLLNPVTNRSVNVIKECTNSYMEMLSEGIPYKGKKVDILVRVTVFSGVRKAKVEAFALTNDPVQFVTGINYHDGVKIFQSFDAIVTWGMHPEDVAADTNEVGGAIMYDPDDFDEKINDGEQLLLISKPIKYLKIWVSSANAKEAEVNTMEKFINFLK